MKIIFNADDFGITDAVSASIVELFKAGTPLKSATVMINLLSDSSAELLKEFLRGDDGGGVSIGLHFNLTCSKPVSPAAEIPSIVGPDLNFLKFGELIGRACDKKIDVSHVVREFEAQMNAFYARLGFWPSHIDSHKHVHMLPDFFHAVAGSLKKFETKRIRLTENISAEELFTSQGIAKDKIMKCFAGNIYNKNGIYSYGSNTALAYPDLFFGTYSVGSLSAEVFEKEISGLENFGGVGEYMTHPGACDGNLAGQSSLLAPRESEFRALKDPLLAETLKKLNIEAVSYKALDDRKKSAVK